MKHILIGIIELIAVVAIWYLQIERLFIFASVLAVVAWVTCMIGIVKFVAEAEENYNK